MTPAPRPPIDPPCEPDLSMLAEARVAVMITAFRIGPVLSDTILSALDQRHVRPVAVLLVVDGCPDTETTRAIAERYLAAYPGQFQVLWLENGGVSRARNRGLQWLLDCHPDLDAIYCLDGDDLISTTSVASGLLALKDAQTRHPDRRFGWVVTNKMNFGDDHTYVETPERFRPTSYLSVNLSQPSCLYNADMFRQGLRWDETMRSGIEDWEFWLAAIGGDYEGVFNPRDLLYYRRLMGNRSSVNRRNDAYNIPYMRRKHAPLFHPQAVLADEQANTPRFAIGPPDANEFDLITDPGEPGRPLALSAARNAIAARLQRHAPEAYVYDPYAPELFVVMDETLRAALLDRGLLRGLLMSAAELLTGDVAIVEGLIQPLTEQQRQTAGPDDAFLFPIEAVSSPGDWAKARRSFHVIRPGKLAGVDSSQPPAQRLTHQTRRLLLHSDRLPPVAERGHENGQLMRLIRQLTAGDADGAETRLGDAQARSGRYYISSRQIARHAPLTQTAIGTGPLFPQLSISGHRRIAVILPPDGPTPAARRLLDALGRQLDGSGRITIFGTGNHLPDLNPDLPSAIENVASLAIWFDRMDLRPEGHNVGVPCWDGMAEPLLNRLAGLLAPFDEVFSFDLQIFAPVMLKLRGLGVNTVSCQADGPDDDDMAPQSQTGYDAAVQVPDDPVAALNYAAAYGRIICESQARADLLSALGYPLSRIDMGAAAYVETMKPGLAAAAE